GIHYYPTAAISLRIRLAPVSTTTHSSTRAARSFSTCPMAFRATCWSMPGIHVKADQIRAHVAKNPKTFPKATRELVNALYPPEEKMKALMEEDSQRYLKALAKAGVHQGTFEPIMTM